MIAKISTYPIIVILFGLLSCKKEVDDSDIIFPQSCDFSGSKVENITRLRGSLSYTDNIMDLPPSEVYPSEHEFLIRSTGRLQMVVCNMPSSFEMPEGESRSVTFSGQVVVLPDEVDAANTQVELSYLKFE
ncbi:hypothetical protein JHJ32_07535 [Parapedobacter sp. ISTM3]|uniref:hypothetical protein n=1 Tax=Parapedobacter sp. ISTM3 TaxID=2800130 RepID=UPI00190336CA|nr:hypothetical protein [Parapedobacter sp. ISTM3]MBK1439830.1 hypothetical protein [Parapedobacter sp. ISTM3]